MYTGTETLLLEIARIRLQNRPGAFQVFEHELRFGDLHTKWYIHEKLRMSDSLLSQLLSPKENVAWHQENMQSFIDNWAEQHLAQHPMKVESLPPLPGTVVNAETPRTHEPQAAAPAPVATKGTIKAQPNTEKVELEARTERPMSRKGLVAAHKSRWPTIEADLKDAASNGLAEAKAGKRGWIESKCLEWARAKGKYRLLEDTREVNQPPGVDLIMAAHYGQLATTIPRTTHTR